MEKLKLITKKYNVIIFSIFILLLVSYLFFFKWIQDEDISTSLNDIENINLEKNEILFESKVENIIDKTTEKDIDELIDILFDTNIN